jgi:hypothetical protein
MYMRLLPSLAGETSRQRGNGRASFPVSPPSDRENATSVSDTELADAELADEDELDRPEHEDADAEADGDVSCDGGVIRIGP